MDRKHGDSKEIEMRISMDGAVKCDHVDIVLVDVRNPEFTWELINLVNNGINYQPQLVQDFFHQQYIHDYFC